MSLNSKLTIIIPTQDRHRLIKRCIDYYRDFRTNIYIVDSTKNQFDILIEKQKSLIPISGFLAQLVNNNMTHGLV